MLAAHSPSALWAMLSALVVRAGSQAASSSRVHACLRGSCCEAATLAGALRGCAAPRMASGQEGCMHFVRGGGVRAACVLLWGTWQQLVYRAAGGRGVYRSPEAVLNAANGRMGGSAALLQGLSEADASAAHAALQCSPCGAVSAPNR